MTLAAVAEALNPNKPNQPNQTKPNLPLLTTLGEFVDMSTGKPTVLLTRYTFNINNNIGQYSIIF